MTERMTLYKITFLKFPFPFFDYFEDRRKAKKWANKQNYGKSKIERVDSLI